MPRSITVLGAGVVGLCCAVALQRAGFAVQLVDRADPGMGCSLGNAGMIQTGSVMPLAAPGILRQVPRMLLDPEAALVLRWSQVPRLLPWFATLLRQARQEQFAANTRALASLLSRAKAAYRSVAGSAVIQSVFRPRGELYVFADKRAYDAAAVKHKLLREHGIEYRPLAGQALQELEPALSPRYQHGYYLPDSEYVIDPLALSKRLFESFLQGGGTFVRSRVDRLSIRDGGTVLLAGEGSSMPCERLVLATGAAAGGLSKMLGMAVPVEPLKGYHVTVPGGGVTLAGPVIDGSMNIAATPMGATIRLAGTLEFAGFSAEPNWRRAAMLLPMARRMLPDLAAEASDRWAGDRPGTPDGLPVLGRMPHLPNVWCAFGHGTLGLTLGAITGQLIAQSVAELPTSVDLAAFAPGRFN